MEHMQVPCASKYLPCVTEKGTYIRSVINRCIYITLESTRVRRWVTEPMQVPIIETQHSIDTCIYSVTHAHICYWQHTAYVQPLT